jgi:response regulator RpfG family c-di-GMP phosphodiesterase
MQPVNVLLVDDQLSSLMALEDILQSLDANLVKAGSARQALRMMIEHSIDCVLLDVSMPEMDGFEFLQTLQQAPAHKAIPVIMVTGKVFSENETLRAYQYGAVDFLLKPLDTAMVFRKVSFFVNQARRIKSIEAITIHLHGVQANIIEPLQAIANASESGLQTQVAPIISHLRDLQVDWLASLNEKSL